MLHVLHRHKQVLTYSPPLFLAGVASIPSLSCTCNNKMAKKKVAKKAKKVVKKAAKKTAKKVVKKVAKKATKKTAKRK